MTAKEVVMVLLMLFHAIQWLRCEDMMKYMMLCKWTLVGHTLCSAPIRQQITIQITK
jgi:hypothetical protein